jgi:hypothetical protein
MQQPGIKEQILAEAAQIFDGQIIFGEDLLKVPIGNISLQKIR